MISIKANKNKYFLHSSSLCHSFPYSNDLENELLFLDSNYNLSNRVIVNDDSASRIDASNK